MEPVTLFIGVAASVVAWRTTLTKALCIYFAVLLLYPQFLTVRLGVADFNTSRILIAVVFARLILQTRLLQNMQWTLLDKLILIEFFLRSVALTANVPLLQLVEREGGAFFDTVMPFLAVRAIVRTRQDFRLLIRALVMIAMPLAAMGAYQCLTGHNPMGFMKTYNSFATMEQLELNRYGFFRADVSFGQYIGFGMFFAGLAPLVFTLRTAGRSSFATLVWVCIVVVGALSSMSSAPLFSLVVSGMLVLFYPFRKYGAVLVIAIVASMVFLELYSNRHFYEVLTRFAMSGDTAYYRIGLINEAFGGGMDGHWIFGYGYVGIGPGNDNTNFHWEHTDLVNIYIGSLARVGLVGTIPFLLLNVRYYADLRKAWRLACDVEGRWNVWCLMAALVGWNVAMMTVGPVAALQTLLPVFIALVGCLVAIHADSLPDSHREGRKMKPSEETERRLLAG